MINDEEIWMPISDYSNYMVSNYGRVKSLNFRRTGKENILKPRFLNNGYLFVGLCKEGKSKGMLVHRLVATAFVENPNLKPQVNHKNGIKTDNKSQNLEWASHKENINHAWDNGLYDNVRDSVRISSTGENNGGCKLTDSDCEKIRLRYSKGNTSLRILAEEFGCSRTHISNIINNKQRTKLTPQ